MKQVLFQLMDNTNRQQNNNKLVSAKLTQYRSPLRIFGCPAGPLGDRYWNARRIVRDRPPFLCKISAKSVQQSCRRCVPNRQTDRQRTNWTSRPL